MYIFTNIFWQIYFDNVNWTLQCKKCKNVPELYHVCMYFSTLLKNRLMKQVQYKWMFYRLMSVLMKWDGDVVQVDPGSPPSKPGCDQPSSPEASSAYLGIQHSRLLFINYLFLGPKLWEKPIQAKFNEDDFFVMNIDEFLAENNLQVISSYMYPNPKKSKRGSCTP